LFIKRWPDATDVLEFRSRSAIQISPLAGEPTPLGCRGNQDDAVAPLSHPFVERLIGAIRRECLDRTLFSTAADLETKLRDFQHDFNGYRAHSGLGGQPPKSMADQNRPRANIDSYRWQTHCRGLYQTPIAACEGTVDLSAHALEFAMDTHRGALVGILIPMPILTPPPTSAFTTFFDPR